MPTGISRRRVFPCAVRPIDGGVRTPRSVSRAMDGDAVIPRSRLPAIAVPQGSSILLDSIQASPCNKRRHADGIEPACTNGAHAIGPVPAPRFLEAAVSCVFFETNGRGAGERCTAAEDGDGRRTLRLHRSPSCRTRQKADLRTVPPAALPFGLRCAPSPVPAVAPRAGVRRRALGPPNVSPTS